MLIAKCEECGYVERVPDNYAGCDLECPCGRTVHVPSRFKLKEPAPTIATASRQVHRQKVPVKLPKKKSTTIYGLTMNSDESLRFGRLQFFLHMIASSAVCFVSFLIFGLTFPHLIFFIICSVWAVVVTQKRLDDCGFNNIHAVPLVVCSIISLISVLNPNLTLNLPMLASINIIFSLWWLGVFVACLFQPGKTGARNEA